MAVATAAADDVHDDDDGDDDDDLDACRKSKYNTAPFRSCHGYPRFIFRGS